MFRPKHILALSMLLVELGPISEPAQQAQQETSKSEKKQPHTNASTVSCRDRPQSPSRVSPSNVQCTEEEFRIAGKPLMLSPRNGISFGVSSPSTDSTDVFIWMDNRTDQTQTYGMMCSVSYLGAFAIYNSAGERVLSKGEQRSRQPSSPAEAMEMEICSCCIVQSIRPHTLQVVDHGSLSNGYILTAGSYFIVPVDPRAPKQNSSKTNQAAQASVLSNSITIVIPIHRQ